MRSVNGEQEITVHHVSISEAEVTCRPVSSILKTLLLPLSGTAESKRVPKLMSVS